MIEGKKLTVFFTVLIIIEIIVFVLTFKPSIVGYTVFDREVMLEELTQLEAYVGEEFRIKITGDGVFSDDSDLFDISEDGLIKFTPTEEMIGTHYTAIIAKDSSGRGDVKIIPFVIRK